MNLDTVLLDEFLIAGVGDHIWVSELFKVFVALPELEVIASGLVARDFEKYSKVRRVVLSAENFSNLAEQLELILCQTLITSELTQDVDRSICLNRRRKKSLRVRITSSLDLV